MFVGCFHKKKSLIAQLSVPKWVDESNYNEHFREQENPAPPLFQPIPRSYLTVLENHSSTTTVAMATRGEIHFINPFVTLHPSVPPLSLFFSHYLQPSFSLSLYAISCYSSFFLSHSENRQAAEDATPSINRTMLWHQDVIIPCFRDDVLGWIMLCHLLCWLQCDTFALCTSYQSYDISTIFRYVTLMPSLLRYISFKLFFLKNYIFSLLFLWHNTFF